MGGGAGDPAGGGTAQVGREPCRPLLFKSFVIFKIYLKLGFMLASLL